MYSRSFEVYADFLKALAHPRRLEIIHLLRDQELPVSDIHTMLDLPQANISQHLMILRDANVVVARRAGKQIYYRLADKQIIKASDIIRQVLIAQHGESQLTSELSLKMKDLVPITQDPVCGMRLSPRTAGFHCDHSGHEYFFCASGCLAKFKKEPEKYV